MVYTGSGATSVEFWCYQGLAALASPYITSDHHTALVSEP